MPFVLCLPCLWLLFCCFKGPGLCWCWPLLPFAILKFWTRGFSLRPNSNLASVLPSGPPGLLRWGTWGARPDQWLRPKPMRYVYNVYITKPYNIVWPYHPGMTIYSIIRGALMLDTHTYMDIKFDSRWPRTAVEHQSAGRRGFDNIDNCLQLYRCNLYVLPLMCHQVNCITNQVNCVTNLYDS